MFGTEGLTEKTEEEKEQERLQRMEEREREDMQRQKLLKEIKYKKDKTRKWNYMTEDGTTWQTNSEEKVPRTGRTMTK